MLIGLLATPAAARNDSAGMLARTGVHLRFESARHSPHPRDSRRGHYGEALDLGVPISDHSHSPRPGLPCWSRPWIKRIARPPSRRRRPRRSPPKGSRTASFSAFPDRPPCSTGRVSDDPGLTGLPDAPRSARPPHRRRRPPALPIKTARWPRPGQDSAWPASFEAMAFRRNSRELVAIARTAISLRPGVSRPRPISAWSIEATAPSDPVALRPFRRRIAAFCRKSGRPGDRRGSRHRFAQWILLPVPAGNAPSLRPGGMCSTSPNFPINR